MNRSSQFLLVVSLGIAVVSAGCDRFGGGRNAPAVELPQYRIVPPPGWTAEPGKGIGPARTHYALQTYGGFKANIQVFEGTVDDLKPSEDSKVPSILERFWYEGNDQHGVRQELTLITKRKARDDEKVAGADRAGIYQYQSVYASRSLVQTKLVVVRGKECYVVSCSALRSNFKGYESQFKATIESFAFTPKPGADQPDEETATRPSE